MSGIAMQTETAPIWKQEINRRVAEHKRRKFDASDALPLWENPRPEVSRRAQAAAARVAARYANAPSYGDVLSDPLSDAFRDGDPLLPHAAARVAEVDAMAGLEAQIRGQIQIEKANQVQAESVVAEMHALTEPLRELSPASQIAEPLDAVQVEPVDDFFPPGTFPVAPLPAIEPAVVASQAHAVEWEPAPRRYGLSIEELPVAWLAPEQSWEGAEAENPPQSVHTDMIENPTAVAPGRKARSRRAESAVELHEAPLQLSIFEVEPQRIAAQPNWPVIELEPHPEVEAVAVAPLDSEKVAAAPPAIDLAQMHRRLLAGLVDASLVAGAVLSVLAFSLRFADVLPGVRQLEMNAVLGFGAALIVYQALFMMLASATPGMMYARVRLTTLDGRKPSFEQRMNRFWAFLISMLPVGLGMAWSIFDEDGMAWHDRLSSTCLKNSLY